MVMVVKSSKETWGHNWSSPSYECWTLNSVVCISSNRRSYSCCVGCPLKMALIWSNIILHCLNLKSSYHIRWSYGDMWDFENVVANVGIPPWKLLRLWIMSPRKIYIIHIEWWGQGVWILTHMGKWLILDGHVNCEDIFKRYVWVSIQLSFHRH